MYAIHTDGLTKRYGDRLAIDALDLRIEAGEVFGLVGPNGAGKSTTIGLLVGFRRPTAGEIAVQGHSPVTDPVAVRTAVGLVPERPGVLDRISGRRHLQFLARIRGADVDPSALLDRVGLAPADGNANVEEYSTGMVKRLQLAMALVGPPDVLVLDEPASGLDPAGIDRLRQIVRVERDRGATVLFSSHHLADVAAVSDRVGFLVDGRLLETIEDAQDEDRLADRFHELVGATDGS